MVTKNRPHFLLDMDGVLSDIFTELLHTLNPIFKTHISTKSYAREVSHYDVAKFFGITNSELWGDFIAKEEDFWLRMPAFPWAQQLYNLLLDRGEVTIVTTPVHDYKCSVQKLQWLKKVLGISQEDVFLGSKKYLMAGNGILIDDYPKNIDSFRAHGGQAILVPSNWNTVEVSFELVKNTIINHLQEWEQKSI